MKQCTYWLLCLESLKHVKGTVPACFDVVDELEELEIWDCYLGATTTVDVKCFCRFVEERNKALDLHQ